MAGMFNVRSSPRPRAPNLQSSPLPCARYLRRGHPPTPATPPIPQRMPSLRLGRPETPCPTPTSCSSVVRGRAPRPSPPLATARAGVRGPARPHSQTRPP
eukprot:scaffold66525_cov60-Phaeocystis_antarctica.AAC.1